jgi:hypothetical protein
MQVLRVGCEGRWILPHGSMPRLGVEAHPTSDVSTDDKHRVRGDQSTTMKMQLHITETQSVLQKFNPVGYSIRYRRDEVII